MRLPGATPRCDSYGRTDGRTNGESSCLLEITYVGKRARENRRIFIMTANEIKCPVCGAASGEACTNPLTGEPYRHYAPHLERIREAGKR